MLFGGKVKMEIPLPNGGIKKLKVTKKWLKKMEIEGKIKQISEKVKVNILDPIGLPTTGGQKEFINSFFFEPQNEVWHIEYWTLGTEISQEQYQNFIDSKTKELYAIRVYDNDKIRTRLISRSLWEQGYKAMKNI